MTSNTAKHTPGPWKITGRETLDRYGYQRVTIRGGIPDAIDTIVTVGNNEANARLIAAAPDMLAALGLAYGELVTMGYAVDTQHQPQYQSTLRDIESIIAKATQE